MTIDTFTVNQHIKGGATGYDAGTGWWLGIDINGTPKFFIGDAAGDKMTWDGTTLSISGSLIAGSIDIPDADTTAESFHVDSTGNMWIGATTTNKATAPFRVSNDGDVVATNITATGTINATGGYVGTTTALVFESQGIDCGVTGYIRGNQTDFNTGTGWFLGNSGGEYKFSIGNPDGNYLTWNGTDLTLVGNMILNSVLSNVSYTVANLPTPPSTAGFNSPSAND